MTAPAEVSPRVAALLKKTRLREAAEAAETAGLPRLTCACGQQLWGDEALRVVCCKCFGAFIITPSE